MHIGLIGGIGPAATDVYYRGLISRAAQMGRDLDATIVHADAPTLLDNLAANGANLTNRECDGVIPVTGVFWDGPVSGVVNDCSSDGLAVSGSATEPYALCTVAPSDPDCVGALIQVR